MADHIAESCPEFVLDQLPRKDDWIGSNEVSKNALSLSGIQSLLVAIGGCNQGAVTITKNTP